MIDRDKNELGLTEQAREAFDAVVEAAGFNERQDAYRLAIAVALQKGLEPTAEGLSRKTYVNIGGLDRDGSLRAAVLQLRSDHGSRPYALLERLAEAGVEDMKAHFDAGRSVREYLEKLVEMDTD